MYHPQKLTEFPSLIARSLWWALETLGLNPDRDSPKAGLRNRITNKTPRRKQSRHAAAETEKASLQK